MEGVAIKVKNVSKTFKLPNEKHNSIKSIFVNFYRSKKGYQLQSALKDVSFEVKQGEFFGVVGRNGSGKSTLLKLMAGIYIPTKGEVEVRGSLTPFIELGVGFNPELTGRENIYLNGALLGFDRKEMRSMYKDIVDFAELGRFMDQKLKNYSSGMQVRLAFSIAIRVQSQILLIDEVLAVGDLDFQKKCYNYFLELRRQKKTIIFVSHDMAAVRRFCTRCILISEGELVKEGSAEEIADMYEKLNLQASERWLSKSSDHRQSRVGSGEATINKAETFDADTGKPRTTFSPDKKIGVRIYIDCNTDIPAPTVGFIFQDENDATVMATNNQILKTKTKPLARGQKVIMECLIDNIFTNGEYSITAAVESQDFSEVYDRVEYINKFLIDGHKLPHALTHPAQKIKFFYPSGR